MQFDRNGTVSWLVDDAGAAIGGIDSGIAAGAAVADDVIYRQFRIRCGPAPL